MINVTPTISLLEIVYSALALCGLLVMAYATLDNRRDLAMLRQRGVNSVAKLTASIGVWDSVSAGIFHALFLSLGVIGMMTPPPRPALQASSLFFGLGFIGMQALILGVQVRNQLARLRIRRYFSRGHG